MLSEGGGGGFGQKADRCTGHGVQGHVLCVQGGNLCASRECLGAEPLHDGCAWLPDNVCLCCMRCRRSMPFMCSDLLPSSKSDAHKGLPCMGITWCVHGPLMYGVTEVGDA